MEQPVAEVLQTARKRRKPELLVTPAGISSKTSGLSLD
jgi:hypothetical protein